MEVVVRESELRLFRRTVIVMGQQISKMVKLAVRKGGFCFENKETVLDQRPGRAGIALRKKEWFL